MAYRIIFSLIVYVGATQALDLVWNISDIMNALMAIPNLISLIVLSGTIKEEVERFQPILEKEKKARKAHAGNAGIPGTSVVPGFFYFIVISSYSLVPSPIFSPCSRVSFHAMFGLLSLKWSW